MRRELIVYATSDADQSTPTGDPIWEGMVVDFIASNEALTSEQEAELFSLHALGLLVKNQSTGAVFRIQRGPDYPYGRKRSRGGGRIL